MTSAKLPVWNTIGAEELAAVKRVLDRGTLSNFHGTWSERFLGGEEVCALESEWAQFFGVAHAVSVNSATSGLYAAMGAIGISPGDEVIVTPTSMSASATAPLIYGGIPIFADINDTTFTLELDSVKKNITPHTKAILAVNLFGHPADLRSLRDLADQHHLALIEDSAQAPGATFHDQFAGTIGDIGVFSLNCHKHIQTGEGGVCVTNNARLAERLQLIRNHAEAVVEAKQETDLTNMIGWNYRMTELEAALGRCQLAKLPKILDHKVGLAENLRARLANIPGIVAPVVQPQCRHVYYVFPLRVQHEILGCSRERVATALQDNGIPVAVGYVKPLYLAPLFQQQIAFGRNHFPFTMSRRDTPLSYAPGLCPVAERLYNDELLYFPWCSFDFDERSLDTIVHTLKKIRA